MLTSWLSSVMFNCVFVTFQCGILCQVWYWIVSVPDLCHLSYFVSVKQIARSLGLHHNHYVSPPVRGQLVKKLITLDPQGIF